MRGLHPWPLVLSLALCGCAGMQAAEQASHLELNLMAYARLMRWGEFREASQYHRTVSGAALEAPLPSRDIRISGFDFGTPGATTPATATAPAQVMVPVTMTFYSDTSPVVERKEYVQHWWFEAESKHWFMSDPFPDLDGATP